MRRILALVGAILLAAVCTSASAADDASFVSETVPSTMTTGTVYSVSVKMKNTGTTTWTNAALYWLKDVSTVPGVWGVSTVSLPGTTGPNGNATFNFNVTAPTTPGTYSFKWKMHHQGASGDFGTGSGTFNIVVSAGDSAHFVSQSVPATMTVGQVYAVTETFTNNGTTTWDSATYHLGSQNAQDNTTWGLSRINLTGAVAPTANATFSYNVTAPSTPGSYNFQWNLLKDGTGPFGDLSTNQVIVVSTGNNAQFISQSVPSTMLTGQSYPVTVTYKNTGTTTWSPGANYDIASSNAYWTPTHATIGAGVTVAPGSNYTYTFNVTAPAGAGTYAWQWRSAQEGVESYGDQTPPFNVGVSGSAPTTTALTSAQNPTGAGTNVTLTATVTGTAPTGTVQFTDGGVVLTSCTAVPLVGGGNAPNATCTFNSSSIATHTIVAVYPGDSTNAASTSPNLLEVVTAAASTNVALASNGGVASASTTYSASYNASSAIDNERAGVTWGNNGGWNDNTLYTFPDWLQVNFSATYTISKVVVYTLQDDYTHPIEPTDGMTFNYYGVTDFTVQGWNGSSWVTLATVSGNSLVKRVVTFSPYSTSRVRINVTNAQGGYARITELEAWTVSSTTVVGLPNPSALGGNATLTASITAVNPTGSVNFTDGGTTIAGCGAIPLTGSGNTRTAQCVTSALTAGNHSIVVAYGGDAGNPPSTSAPLIQVVNIPGTNVALASNGGVASASTTYSTGFAASGTNDNVRSGAGWGTNGGWNDNTGNTFPDWLQINFNGSKTINRVVVYTLEDNYTTPVEPTDTMTFTLYGLVDFTVQGWNGSTWVTLATVSGNNLVKRTVNFAAYTTDRIRINVTNALGSYSRIVEVEAWTATPDQGPSVTMTAPANNANYTTGATIPLTATASDSDGSISQVEFYQNAQLIGTVTTPVSGSYSFNWATTLAGAYALSAKAYDNFGATATFTGISVTVSDPAAIRYAYDGLGRLTGVVDASGNAARYVYDPAGNVTRIDRINAGSIGILGSEPPSGAVGTSITLSGLGFSATPAQNTVTFNGVAASVTSATTSQLVVTVPAGAITGVIGVTSPAGATTSVASFTVQPAPALPSISGFAPASGSTGVSATINGTNFGVGTGANEVKFNGVVAAISSATATAITAIVPASATTGHISVRTGTGSATSSGIFTIPIAGHTAGDVASQATITADGSSVVLNGINNASGTTIGVLVFDGTVGQSLGLGISSVSHTGSGLAGVTVVRPDGVTLSTIASLAISGAVLTLPNLPVSGTYSIVFAPAATTTASATFTLSNAIAGTTTPDSPTGSAIASVRIGQGARYTFAGSSGKAYGFTLTGLAAGAYAYVTVLRPGGGVLISRYLVSSPGRALASLPSSQAGNYTVVVEPGSVTLLSATLTVLNDNVGAILFSGPAQSITIDRPGRATLLSFTLGAASSIAPYVVTGSVYATPYDSNGVVQDYGTPGNIYYLLVTPSTLAAPGSASVQVGSLDLTFQGSVSAPSFVQAHLGACTYEFDVSYTLTNTGSLPLTGSWEDEVAMARNADGGGGRYAVQDVQHATTTLNPGATLPVSVHFSLPYALYGPLYAVVTANDEYSISYEDSGDNTNASAQPVAFSTNCIP